MEPGARMTRWADADCGAGGRGGAQAGGGGAQGSLSPMEGSRNPLASGPTPALPWTSKSVREILACKAVCVQEHVPSLRPPGSALRSLCIWPFGVGDPKSQPRVT